MQTFIKLFLVVFAIILFAGISQQRELIAVWVGQASKALGMQDEIYQWNTDIAWEKPIASMSFWRRAIGCNANFYFWIIQCGRE